MTGIFRVPEEFFGDENGSRVGKWDRYCTKNSRILNFKILRDSTLRALSIDIKKPSFRLLVLDILTFVLVMLTTTVNENKPYL